jgi:hypothetical protein
MFGDSDEDAEFGGRLWSPVHTGLQSTPLLTLGSQFLRFRTSEAHSSTFTHEDRLEAEQNQPPPPHLFYRLFGFPCSINSASGSVAKDLTWMDEDVTLMSQVMRERNGMPSVYLKFPPPSEEAIEEEDDGEEDQARFLHHYQMIRERDDYPAAVVFSDADQAMDLLGPLRPAVGTIGFLPKFSCLDYLESDDLESDEEIQTQDQQASDEITIAFGYVAGHGLSASLVDQLNAGATLFDSHSMYDPSLGVSCPQSTTLSQGDVVAFTRFLQMNELMHDWEMSESVFHVVLVLDSCYSGDVAQF